MIIVDFYPDVLMPANLGGFRWTREDSHNSARLGHPNFFIILLFEPARGYKEYSCNFPSTPGKVINPERISVNPKIQLSVLALRVTSFPFTHRKETLNNFGRRGYHHL